MRRALARVSGAVLATYCVVTPKTEAPSALMVCAPLEAVLFCATCCIVEAAPISLRLRYTPRPLHYYRAVVDKVSNIICFTPDARDVNDGMPSIEMTTGGDASLHSWCCVPCYMSSVVSRSGGFLMDWAIAREPTMVAFKMVPTS